MEINCRKMSFLPSLLYNTCLSTSKTGLSAKCSHLWLPFLVALKAQHLLCQKKDGFSMSFTSIFHLVSVPLFHSTKQGTSVVHMLVLSKGTLVHSLRREARCFLQLTWLTEQLFYASPFSLSPVTALFIPLTSHQLSHRIKGLSLRGQQLLCFTWRLRQQITQM